MSSKIEVRARDRRATAAYARARGGDGYVRVTDAGDGISAHSGSNEYGAAESRLRQTWSQAAPRGSIGFPEAQVM